MRHAKLFGILLPFCFSLVACGADDDDKNEGTAAGKWGGASEHLSAQGSVGDKAIDISLSGVDAQDIETFFCERNYQDGALEHLELKYSFEYEGQGAELELEFNSFDYSKQAENPISVGTASEDAPTASDIAIDLKLETEDGLETEDSAVSGTFELEQLSGTPGADGIIPDGEGTFAGYLDVELASGETLSVSFTAKCGENDLGD